VVPLRAPPLGLLVSHPFDLAAASNGHCVLQRSSGLTRNVLENAGPIGSIGAPLESTALANRQDLNLLRALPAQILRFSIDEPGGRRSISKHATMNKGFGEDR